MIFTPDLSECALDVIEELSAVVMHLLAMLIDAQEDETLELFKDSHAIVVLLVLHVYLSRSQEVRTLKAKVCKRVVEEPL